MTLAIPSNIDISAFQPLLSQDAKGRERVDIKAADMDPATTQALVAGITTQMVVDTGKTPVDVPVNLRASTIPLGEASALLSGIISKLPTMLAQLAGVSDPPAHAAGPGGGDYRRQRRRQ